MKIKRGKIKISEIKHIENSRFRGNEDVSDLMSGMEQHGMLQPVGIRESDKALIYGNRRVTAATKLGWTEVDCDFYGMMSDEELLILNVTENIKRKNINAIELGRSCVILLNKKFNEFEIAKRFGMPVSRVNSLITTYNTTIGTPYEKYVTLGKRNEGIDPSTIQQIQKSIVSKGRILSKLDWNYLLNLTLSGKLTTRKILTLAKICLDKPDLSIDKCIDILNMSTVVESVLTLDNIALRQSMIKEKCDTPNELIKFIVRSYNKHLLF